MNLFLVFHNPATKILCFLCRIMKGKNTFTLGEAIQKMVEELKLQPKIDEARIKDGWAKWMGAPIARYTSQVNFKNGKLYIKVESAVLRNELQFSRDKIKELFNNELGRAVINEVIVF